MPKPHEFDERSPDEGLRSAFAKHRRRSAGEPAIEEEIRQEKARQLGHAGEALEAACRQAWALHREARAGSQEAAEKFPAARARALELQHRLILQREAIGLCRHEELRRLYPIPEALRADDTGGVS
jgi:hypothetical protein